MKSKIFTYLMLAFLSVNAFSQERKITGTVLFNNEAVNEALIEAKDYGITTKSDLKGAFQITVPQECKFLTVGATGMLTKEVNISAKTEIVVILNKAGETDLFDLSLEELLAIEITGYSRYKQSISEIANSIQVISNQQIIDRGYFDLSDLLKDMPDIDVISNAGRFGDFYSLRGISGNDRFLVLVNGHKLNPASGTFLSIGKSISIRHAERIEIIYGPASAVYGADAFSGIINIVFPTESPENHEVNVSAYSRYGSMNSFDGGLGGAVKINDDISFNFDARTYISDGFDVVDSDEAYKIIEQYQPPIDNKCEQPISDHNIYLNLNYKDFSINYYRQHFNQGNAFGHNPMMYIFSKDNIWKTTTDMLWANYNLNLTQKSQLNIDITYKNHIQDKNSLFYKWSTVGVVGNSFKQYMTGKDRSLHGLVSYNQEINEQIQFIIGFDNEFTTSIPPYANDEVLGQSFQYEGSNADLIDDKLTIEENRFAGFGQFSYSPISKITLIAGARYDYSSRYEGTFNPRVGIIFSPKESTQIKFAYGSAFQAPSLFYQYEQFGTPVVAMLSTAEMQKINSAWELENQTVESFELAVNHKFNENFDLKATAYYNKLSNLIVRKLFAVYPNDSVYNKYFDKYTGGLRNENAGKEEVFGGNLLFNAKISKNIVLYTFYSYTKAKTIIDNAADVDLPRIAEHKIWVGFSAYNIFNRITISPRFKWVDNMYNLNSAVFSDNEQSGYYNIDVNFKINNLFKYFNVFISAENLLNQDIEHAGFYDQSGVYTATLPQPGLTIMAGLEFNLKP